MLVLATAGRDSPRRATNFLAARPVCRPRRKSAKKRALHPASPKASRCESFGATCARSKRRRAVELPPRQGAPVKQLPRVRARSLAVLRQPNRRRLLRSQALAEGGGGRHPEQPNSRTAEQPNSRAAEQPSSRAAEQPSSQPALRQSASWFLRCAAPTAGRRIPRLVILSVDSLDRGQWRA